MATTTEQPGVGLEARARRLRETPVRIAIVATFAVVLAVTLWRHEMWRDELQAWMLARDSHSWADLLHNIRYEGHPALWYALLRPLTYVSGRPWPMQILEFVVATTTVGLVVFRAPFTLAQKALFAFGYFPLFEYGVLSRSYALGALLVVLVCVEASRPRRPWLLLGATLALLSLTSAFGTILAAALILGLAADVVVRARGHGELERPHLLAGGAAIAIAGALWAYEQAVPPADGGVYHRWNSSFDAGLAGSSLASVWRALVPIPRFVREFWNTNVLDGRTWLAAILGLALLAGLAWLLRARFGALVVWLAGSLGILLFMYSKLEYANAARYYGNVFLALVAALWLASSCAPWSAGGRLARMRDPVTTRSTVWTGILALAVVAGLFAVALDLAIPFSDGRQVARYLERNHLQHAIIVGEPDTSASSVAAYLDERVYYPAGGRSGTFIVWDRAREAPVEPLALVVRGLQGSTNEPVLLLVTRPLDVARFPHLQLLRAFDDGIVVDEHFWLYRVERAPDRAGG